MYKMLIADDEPKIRRGLKNLLEWNTLDIEVVGEAEDGEVALELVKALSPDILLLDINMPFVNGLELVEQINSIQSDCKIIIITGYDEFQYAQKALKLKVYDYLLKPVSKDQLYQVVINAKNELASTRQKNKYLDAARTQLSKNLPFLKEKFLNDFVNNHLTNIEVNEQVEFFNISFLEHNGVILIKIVEMPVSEDASNEWDRQLLLFAMQNILEELLEQWPGVVFKDEQSNLVAITSLTGQVAQWLDAVRKFEDTVEKYLGQTILLRLEESTGGINAIPPLYEKLLNEITEKSAASPVILMAQKYIEENYGKENLSLQEIAEKLNLSPSYLSRLLKNNVGHTFIDLLTKVRINMAIKLMNDPTLKMYEIAERVGYSTQHYFSTAFKKTLGISPLEYRKGGLK